MSPRSRFAHPSRILLWKQEQGSLSLCGFLRLWLWLSRQSYTFSAMTHNGSTFGSSLLRPPASESGQKEAPPLLVWNAHGMPCRAPGTQVGLGLAASVLPTSGPKLRSWPRAPGPSSVPVQASKKRASQVNMYHGAFCNSNRLCLLPRHIKRCEVVESVDVLSTSQNVYELGKGISVNALWPHALTAIRC